MTTELQRQYRGVDHSNVARAINLQLPVDHTSEISGHHGCCSNGVVRRRNYNSCQLPVLLEDLLELHAQELWMYCAHCSSEAGTPETLPVM